jgi:hypothetical protein
MNQTTTFELTSEQATELQVLLDRCVQEVRAAEKRMEQSEAERLQMQAETRVMLNQLKEMLHVENHH